MSHLENLLFEYYEWRGYIVRRNVKVGKLPHGGWEGELDIVAYHPETGDLIHLEPSVDAHSWKTRQQRFKRKFDTGKKYIFKDVFPWLDRKTPLSQVAVFPARGKRETLAGGTIRTIDEVTADICEKVSRCGRMGSAAISEQYGLLRTIQLVRNGYRRVPDWIREPPP